MSGTFFDLEETNMKKKLVAFFSASGTTKCADYGRTPFKPGRQAGDQRLGKINLK